jgi:hypothetical protein
MGAASHLSLGVPRSGFTFWLVMLVIMAVCEANALYAAPGQASTTKPLATVKGTLWAGFVLTLVFYVVFEVMKIR